jgi:hypothetical protein
MVNVNNNKIITHTHHGQKYTIYNDDDNNCNNNNNNNNNCIAGHGAKHPS